MRSAAVKVKVWTVTVTSVDTESGETRSQGWAVWPNQGQQMLRSLRKRYGKPVVEREGSYDGSVAAFDALVMSGDVIKFTR